MKSKRDREIMFLTKLLQIAISTALSKNDKCKFIKKNYDF